MKRVILEDSGAVFFLNWIMVHTLVIWLSRSTLSSPQRSGNSTLHLHKINNNTYPTHSGVYQLVRGVGVVWTCMEARSELLLKSQKQQVKTELVPNGSFWILTDKTNSIGKQWGGCQGAEFREIINKKPSGHFHGSDFLASRCLFISLNGNKLTIVQMVLIMCLIFPYMARVTNSVIIENTNRTESF